MTSSLSFRLLLLFFSSFLPLPRGEVRSGLVARTCTVIGGGSLLQLAVRRSKTSRCSIGRTARVTHAFTTRGTIRESLSGRSLSECVAEIGTCLPPVEGPSVTVQSRRV